MLIALHKPYGFLSQFTDDGSGHPTLASLGLPPRVYAIGRLDHDSEGLLLLSDERQLNLRLLHPDQAHRRTYWAQVEGVPSPEALARLASGGIPVQGVPSRPCRAWALVPSPLLPPRDPPIRIRLTVPDSWIALELTEGRNRQVRRMTAAVGHPTLRLHRAAIGDFRLPNDLPPGQWRVLDPAARRQVLSP